MVDFVVVGNMFFVQVGCDKFYVICCGRFLNGDNFGGFLYMFGNDWIIGYGDKDDLNDGGSLF